ncbi:FG-GAP repeat domain-containing protein [Streptomyces sp. NPDC055239]
MKYASAGERSKGFRRRGGFGLLAAVVVMGTATGARNHEVRPPVPDSACQPTKVASAGTSGPTSRLGTPAPDFDGDGHPDAALDVPAGNGDVYETGKIALVRGSAHGLRPEKRKVFAPKDFQLPEHDSMTGSLYVPSVADLDDDGHPDLIAGASAHVQWGGPEGPAPDNRPARVKLPHIGKGRSALGGKGDGSYTDPPVAGDFDGDGHADLGSGGPRPLVRG